MRCGEELCLVGLWTAGTHLRGPLFGDLALVLALLLALLLGGVVIVLI